MATKQGDQPSMANWKPPYGPQSSSQVKSLPRGNAKNGTMKSLPKLAKKPKMKSAIKNRKMSAVNYNPVKRAIGNIKKGVPMNRVMGPV